MSELSHLQPPPGASDRNRKRIGRGQGSGWGKTSGKGHKGQKSRSGAKIHPGFEGGQMPLARRLPKRGFRNIFRKEFEIISLSQLERFEAGTTVDVALLVESGLIPGKHHGVKILANGEITKPLNIKVHKWSKTAKAKVEAAGGTIEEV